MLIGSMRGRIAATYVAVAVLVSIFWAATLPRFVDEGAVSPWFWAVGSLFISVAAGMLGVIFARWYARPIREVVQMARRLAAGESVPRLRWGGGDELGALAVALNETAESLDERLRQIREDRRRLSVVLDHMTSGVLLIDPRGRLLVANPSARRLLGLRGPETGLTAIEATKSFQLSEAIENVLRTGSEERRQLTLVHGGERWVEASLAAVTDTQGGPAGVVAVLHDVTERVRMEQVRSDFIANVSHELRTPVTAIKGFAETLLYDRPDNPDTLRSFVELINREAERLGNLVEDLLELTRLEAKQVALAREEIDLRQLARDAVERFRARATQRGIDLDLGLPEQPVYCFVDVVRMEQVLANLLDNALKFTAEGGRVQVEVARQGDGGACLTVSDTGVGMKPEEVDRVFERFYRGDRGQARYSPGTGLGLAIVREIVGAHGGQVQVKTTPGRGSSFIVSVPRWGPEPRVRE